MCANLVVATPLSKRDIGNMYGKDKKGCGMGYKKICLVTLCFCASACTMAPEDGQGTNPPPAATEAPQGEVTKIAAVKPKARPETLPQTAVPTEPPSNATTVEDFDTTSVKERKEAVKEAKTATGNKMLGKTITSLGDATEPGLWMKTPLVSKATKGRVENPATGDSVTVDLLPLDGPKSAGSQLSLPAFRRINAPLTSLPELSVYRM